MPAIARIPLGLLPPIVVALSTLAALLLQTLYPLQLLRLGVTWRLVLAAPFVLGGLQLLARARQELKRHGVHPRFKPVSTLVTSGPFRFTRNPMYVGGAAALLGVALASNSVWMLTVGVLPPLLYLELLVIPIEEAALKKEFGKAFVDYCEDTPRWLVCFHHRLWR